MLELVREISKTGLSSYKFNDMTDFDIDHTPREIYEEIMSFNQDLYKEQLHVEVNNEKKWIKIIKEDKEVSANTMIVKIKFFEVPVEEGQDSRFRVRFQRKRGNIMEWYEIFKEIRDAGMKDLLLTTENQLV